MGVSRPWESPALGAVTTDAGALAVQIAAGLGLSSASVMQAIATLRSDSRCAPVRELVGGRRFTINPRLATLMGADGWAPGAHEALELCRGWTEDRIDAN